MGITDAVRYSSGEAERGKTTSTEVGYLYSGKEGRQSAERKGSGRLHILGRLVEAIRKR